MNELVEKIKAAYGEDGFKQMVEVTKRSPFSLAQVSNWLPYQKDWKTRNPEELARGTAVAVGGIGNHHFSL